MPARGTATSVSPDSPRATPVTIARGAAAAVADLLLPRARLLPVVREVSRKAVTAVGLAGAALYADWLVLQPTLGRHLSPVHSYVSELGALTRPNHPLVNVLDTLAGVLVLAFGLALVRLVPPSPPARAGAVLLALSGAAAAADGAGPITCAPSVDAGCTAGGVALHAPVQDLVATAASVLDVVGSVGSMALLGLALSGTAWATTGRAGRRLAAFAVPLAVVVGVLGAWDVDVGLPQRALVVVQSAWLTVLATSIIPRGTARTEQRVGAASRRCAVVDRHGGVTLRDSDLTGSPAALPSARRCRSCHEVGSEPRRRVFAVAGSHCRCDSAEEWTASRRGATRPIAAMASSQSPAQRLPSGRGGTGRRR